MKFLESTIVLNTENNELGTVIKDDGVPRGFKGFFWCLLKGTSEVPVIVFYKKKNKEIPTQRRFLEIINPAHEVLHPEECGEDTEHECPYLFNHQGDGFKCFSPDSTCSRWFSSLVGG